MTCDRIRPLLSLYHDDALSMEERARVRLHIATCASCHAILTSYEHMYAALQSIAAPAPADLRHNVYARIAEIETHRTLRLRLPFGPALLGMIRSVGGTAGLLAVLAGLVAAALRLTTAPVISGPALAMAPGLAASTALSSLVSTVRRGDTRSLPAAQQTAVAPVQADLAAGAPATIDAVTAPSAHSPNVTAHGHIISIAPHSLAPRAVIPFQMGVKAAAKGHAPVMNNFAAGTPSPMPTIPQGDGLVYLRLSDDRPFRGSGNAASAAVEWHALTPGSQPEVLVTPGPPADQMFTGVNASPDGYEVTYAAMGRYGYGGVFGFNVNAPYPVRLLTVEDRLPPNRGINHIFVRQAYLTTGGHLVLSLADKLTVSIVMTSPHSLRTIRQLGMGLASNYVVSPDARRIAWIHRPRNNTGALQIATLTTPSVTQTVDVGRGDVWSSHPVWSADGHSLLFLSAGSPQQRRSGLYVWSERGGAAREIVPPDPTGQRFISGVAWSPGGRYFAYVVTTVGPRGTSEVHLGDTRTGYTWFGFKRPWIGTLAWIHGGILANSRAMGALPQLPVTFTVQSGGMQVTTNASGIVGVPYGSGAVDVQLHFPLAVDWRSVELQAQSRYWHVEYKNPPTAHTIAFRLRGIAPGAIVLTLPQARGLDGRSLMAQPVTLTIRTLAPAVAVPARYDDTSTPARTMMSFYNALDRHEFARAYGYIGDADRHGLPTFAGGYADTQSVAITALLPARYLSGASGASGANVHATTCVGVTLLAHHWNGQDLTFGGWYVLRSMAGQNPQNPHDARWRIMLLHGTDIHPDWPARVPAQAKCVA